MSVSQPPKPDSFDKKVLLFFHERGIELRYLYKRNFLVHPNLGLVIVDSVSQSRPKGYWLNGRRYPLAREVIRAVHKIREKEFKALQQKEPFQ